jgi:hypothetical protein
MSVGVMTRYLFEVRCSAAPGVNAKVPRSPVVSFDFSVLVTAIHTLSLHD